MKHFEQTKIKIHERETQLLVGILIYLTIIFDSLLGGVVFLNIMKNSKINIFLLLIISNILYGAYYYYFAVYFKPRFHTWYFTMVGIITLLFITFFYVLLQTTFTIPLILYFILVFLFTFSSTSLLAFSTTLLSESIEEYKRGAVTGTWSAIALLIAGLSELEIVEKIPTKNSLIMLTSLGFITYVIISALFLHYWTRTHRKTIDRLQTNLPRKAISFRDRWVVYAIVTTSIFIFASGMIYSILLKTQPLYITSYRGYGFMIASPFLFIINKYSDKVGRHVILFIASITSLFSVIVGTIFNRPVACIALELMGYYLIISFFMLQITDLYPQKLYAYAGALWAIVYTTDLLGAYFAEMLIPWIEITGVFILASFILVLSIIFSSLIPNFFLKESILRAILIINEDGMVLYREGHIKTDNKNMELEDELYGALLFAIKNFANQLTGKNVINRIQLDKDTLAILGKEETSVVVIFVDHYSERIEEKFSEFIKRVEKIVKASNKESRYTLKEKYRQQFKEAIDLFFPEFKNNKHELNS